MKKLNKDNKTNTQPVLTKMIITKRDLDKIHEIHPDYWNGYKKKNND